jgi:hypothetical protein
MLARQVVEAVIAIGQAGLIHEHAWDAFADRERQATSLADEPFGGLLQKGAPLGIQGTAEQLQQFGTYHVRFSRRTEHGRPLAL